MEKQEREGVVRDNEKMKNRQMDLKLAVMMNRERSRIDRTMYNN